VTSERRLLLLVAALATLVVGTSCVASWAAIVKYSVVPAPADEGVVAGVYRAALEDVVQPFVLEDSLSNMYHTLYHLKKEQVVVEPDWRAVRIPVPGYWEDSLAHEVQAALAHAMFGATAKRELILHLSPEPGLRTERGNGRPEGDRVWLSGVGFNGDSTIAAVRMIHVNYCSAFDTVLMLARRPGYRWKVFNSVMLGGWIS
jgi:hypothetical protein